MSQKKLELIMELIAILYTYDSKKELIEKNMRKAVSVNKIMGLSSRQNAAGTGRRT